jgi:hypothetical protein
LLSCLKTAAYIYQENKLAPSITEAMLFSMLAAAFFRIAASYFLTMCSMSGSPFHLQFLLYHGKNNVMLPILSRGKLNSLLQRGK